MTDLSFPSDRQNGESVDTSSLRFRAPGAPRASELLIAGAARLLEHADMPRSVKVDLYSFKKHTRRVAADRSQLQVLLDAMQYVASPADALFFPRRIEAAVLGVIEY